MPAAPNYGGRQGKFVITRAPPFPFCLHPRSLSRYAFAGTGRGLGGTRGGARLGHAVACPRASSSYSVYAETHTPSFPYSQLARQGPAEPRRRAPRPPPRVAVTSVTAGRLDTHVANPQPAADSKRWRPIQYARRKPTTSCRLQTLTTDSIRTSQTHTRPPTPKAETRTNKTRFTHTRGSPLPLRYSGAIAQ